MNINNFFVIDVGNTDIVVAIIQNFKIFKIKRFKTIVVKKKNFFLFKKFKEIKKILKENKTLKIFTVGSKGYEQLKRIYGGYIIEKTSFKGFKKITYKDTEEIGKKIVKLLTTIVLPQQVRYR